MILIYLTILVFGCFIALEIVTERKKKIEKARILDQKHEKNLPPISDLLKKCQFEIPKGYFVSKRHIWINLLPSGEVRIGLDALCPKLITKIERIKLHDIGDKLNKNGSMCAIYQGTKRLKFYSPIDGTIQEINTELQKNPQTICLDPFEKGWLYKFKPSIPFSNLELNQEQANDVLNWKESELRRLVAFFLKEPTTRSQIEKNFKRGKQVLEGLLDNLDSFGWIKFEESFLA